MSPPRFIAIAAAVVALIHLGCAPVGAGGGEPAALVGRWTVTALQGKVTDTPAGDITFDPADGSISGATSCNFFRGNFDTAGWKLTIKVGMMTRRACVRGAAEHERAFLDAMNRTSTFRIDDDRLILTATDETVLAELIRTPDASLEGPRHKIVSYLKDGGLHSIRANTGAAIAFRDGRIEGDTGCRPFTASYVHLGDSLSISSVTPAQTLAPCAENVRDQDAAILAGLLDINTFDTSRNLIRLLKKQGGAAVLWITPESP
ncbi:MAG: META domain-containing protein [Hyphomicrobiaceae bacterium]